MCSGLAVSDMLYRAFPKGDEGELSRRLADLVRRETCADVARAIDLGAALRLGRFGVQCRRPAAHRDARRRLRGADRRGLRRRRLSGGRRVDRAAVARADDRRRRGRCATRRRCCRNGRRGAGCRRRPTGRWSAQGPHHNPEFRVAVDVPKLAPAEGIGRSKRAAEQAAAAAMLTREGVNANG